MAFIDTVAISIRKALRDTKFPKIKITKNQLTQQENKEIIEDQFMTISPEDIKMPYLLTAGELEGSGELAYDLTLDEYLSVDSIYLASVTEEGTIGLLQKLGQGYTSPDNIFKITNFF